MGYPAARPQIRIRGATALALAYVALASGDRVMMRVLGGDGAKPPTRRSSTGAIESSSWRAVWRDLGRAASSISRRRWRRELVSIRRAGKVFMISDFLMLLNSVTRGLGLFTAANHGLTAVQILGGRELDGQGLDGDVEVVDAETGERLRVSIGEREREQYRETLTRLTREIKSFCLQTRPALLALHHRPGLPAIFPARDARSRTRALKS